MKNSPVKSIQVSEGTQLHLGGELVLRGALERHSALRVNGDIKLGRFLAVADMCTIQADADSKKSGGVIDIAPHFMIPSSVTLIGERRIQFRAQQLPSTGIFDRIKLVAPDMDLLRAPPIEKISAYIYANQNIGSIEEESILKASVLYGPGIHIEGFSEIEARSIRSFSHARGEHLRAHKIRSVHMSDVTACVSEVSIASGSRTLIFFPQSADISEPPSFDIMFNPRPGDYGMLINDLHIRGEIPADAIDAAVQLSTNFRQSQHAASITTAIESESEDSVDDGSNRSGYDLIMKEKILRDDRFDRSCIQIGTLEAEENSTQIRLAKHTMVYVYQGDLTVGSVAGRGVVINVPRGTVEITGHFTEPSNCETMEENWIYANEIHLSSHAAAQVALFGVKLEGAVLVDGIRSPGLEWKRPKSDQ